MRERLANGRFPTSCRRNSRPVMKMRKMENGRSVDMALTRKRRSNSAVFLLPKFEHDKGRYRQHRAVEDRLSAK